MTRTGLASGGGRRRKLASAVVLIAVLALAGAGLLFGAEWLANRSGAQLLTPSDRARLITEERRTLLAALAAIGAGVTLWYTHQRHQLDRDANRTDRFTAAVEQLGDNAKPAVQLGGVYALERVAYDSIRDRAVAFSVLSAFVRQSAIAQYGARPESWYDPETGQYTPLQIVGSPLAASISAGLAGPSVTEDLAAPGWAGSPPQPVLAALDVLGRRPETDSTFPAPELNAICWSGANLHGVNLQQADLGVADLRSAYLSTADFYSAFLFRANLNGADLSFANLYRANLYGADLRGTNLRNASFAEANLNRANLSGTDLSGLELHDTFLRGANLRGAKLHGANLRGANLEGADLYGADLRGADFRGGDLTGVDLSYVNLTGTEQADFDLSDIDGSGDAAQTGGSSW